MASEVVLITGASSGIGAALARRVVRDGRAVALVARRRDRLEALAAELRAAAGVDAHVFVRDLSEVGAASALADEVERAGLGVDWLVNNAGFGTMGRFDRLPLERELQEIRLNVEALVELTHRFLPAMVARGRGVVMNVSSVGGFIPSPYMATYTATKAFVTAFSEGLMGELGGTGVSVLCVCPGFTRTEFQDHIDEAVSQRAPAMAWMSAEDVADEAVRRAHDGGVLVSGRMNRVTAALIRHLPRGLIVRAAGSLLKPPGPQ
jgi:short-subunit dehydrogenase